MNRYTVLCYKLFHIFLSSHPNTGQGSVPSSHIMSDINGLEEGAKEKSTSPDPSMVQDAVFGEITEEGPNYRDVKNSCGQCLLDLLTLPRSDCWGQWYL